MTPGVVTPAKREELAARMERLGMREEDIEESFVRGSGPGGQKINKTSVCVVLTHRPSGLMVRCQETRSRELNRFLARRRLADKLAETIEGEQSQRKQQAEKIRRQKRRRSRRAKEKMLSDKHEQARKKEARGAVAPEE
ncbi:peptide chain release factor-like protein [Candidatus Fermentibacteria bacterium]|nr:peptide chain release factor-like protein [Candidatus Fermentibacteria bacterium]